MGGRNEHCGVVRLDQRLGARFMIGIAIAIEKQNRGRFDAELVEPSPQRGDLAFIERYVDCAIRQHTLAHLEAQRPLHQRCMLLEKQVVGVGSIDAADLVDVAGSLP